MSSLGRAGGARDFCSSACLQSCSWTLSVSHTFCVPEDPASLLIDRLAGKWAIKTSLRLELDLRRPAGVVPHSSSTHEEIFNLDGDKEIFERTVDYGANHQPPILREILFHDFFHHLWYGKVDNLSPSALLNPLLRV